MSDGNQRRAFTRAHLPFPVRLAHENGVIEGTQGIDISAGGVAVRTDQRLPTGTACMIEIHLAEDFVIEAGGVIVRELEDGLALQIQQIGVRSFELLKNLIRFNSDDPVTVDREFEEHLGLLKP